MQNWQSFQNQMISDDLMCKRRLQLSGWLLIPSHCNFQPCFNTRALWHSRPLSIKQALYDQTPTVWKKFFMHITTLPRKFSARPEVLLTHINTQICGNLVYWVQIWEGYIYTRRMNDLLRALWCWLWSILNAVPMDFWTYGRWTIIWSAGSCCHTKGIKSSSVLNYLENWSWLIFCWQRFRFEGEEIRHPKKLRKVCIQSLPTPPTIYAPTIFAVGCKYLSAVSLFTNNGEWRRKRADKPGKKKEGMAGTETRTKEDWQISKENMRGIFKKKKTGM